MNILVTGGAGFVGSHLTDSLLEQGHRVAIIDDLSTGSFKNVEHLVARPQFKCIIESIFQEHVMEELIKEADYVFHLAAAVGVKLVIEEPTKTIETNVYGTQMVLKLCSRYLRPVLIISSSEVYGEGVRERFQEEDMCIIGPPHRRRWSYAASKALEEYLAFAYWHEKHLPVTIVRLFNTVGPRQTDRYGMVVPTFVKQALKGDPITVYGDGKQTRSFLYVKDAVTALAKLMTCPQAKGEVFNVGTEQEISIEDLAKLTISLAKSNSTIKYIPYRQAYGEEFEDMRRRVPDISKLDKAIDFQPQYRLEDILKEMLIFYKARV